MKNTFQFENIDMLMHGKMVFHEYENLLKMINEKNMNYFNSLGFKVELDFLEKLKYFQHDYDKMKSYHIYHDCGKHLSKTIDQNGKIHYAQHATYSSKLYNEYFNNAVSQDLILKDMNFHILKSEELKEWIFSEDKKTLCSLYLTALSEILANSKMFGGIEGESFKIKRKKLIKSGKILISRLKD